MNQWRHQDEMEGLRSGDKKKVPCGKLLILHNVLPTKKHSLHVDQEVGIKRKVPCGELLIYSTMF